MLEEKRGMENIWECGGVGLAFLACALIRQLRGTSQWSVVVLELVYM